MKKKRRCCICHELLPRGEWGNNPEPLMPLSSGVCCDKCNRDKVLPTKAKKPKGDWVVRDKEPL